MKEYKIGGDTLFIPKLPDKFTDVSDAYIHFKKLHEYLDKFATVKKRGRFGSEDGYADCDIDGVFTLYGNAKRGLTLRPTIDVIAQIAKSKPTQVTLGAHKLFSMPIYDSDDEQLFLGCVIPKRWDGESDITARVMCMLSGAEDVGDKFKFSLEYALAHAGHVATATTTQSLSEIIVLTDRSAQYAVYALDFTIDYDTVGCVCESDHVVSMVLKRIDAADHEVSNEILLFQGGSDMRYQIDKFYGEV